MTERFLRSIRQKDAVLVDSSEMTIDESCGERSFLLYHTKYQKRNRYEGKSSQNCRILLWGQTCGRQSLSADRRRSLTIYTLGPIIHNEEVVSDLEKRAWQVISEKDLDQIRGGTVVIRSPWSRERYLTKLKENGLAYVDVTCPFVLKIHRIVEKESQAGSRL